MFYLGIDLGKMRDHTAIAIVEIPGGLTRRRWPGT
jgi:phage terminase large subunit-like protein